MEGRGKLNGPGHNLDCSPKIEATASAQPVEIRRGFDCSAGFAFVQSAKWPRPASFSIDVSLDTIWFITAGNAQVLHRRVNGRQAPRDPIRGGEFNFLPAGTSHSGRAEGALRCVGVRINSDFFQKITRDLATSNSQGPAFGKLDPLCTELGRQIESDLLTNCSTQLMVESAVSIIILRTLPLGLKSGASLRRKVALSKRELGLICDRIDTELPHDISLAELADALDMSIDCFARAFKNSTGEPPYRYILRRRIDRARNLLRASNEPIAQIALSVGFNSQSHLTAHFRRLLRITPARYRSQSD